MDQNFKKLELLIRNSQEQTVKDIKSYIDKRIYVETDRLERLIKEHGEQMKEELREEMQEGYLGIAELIQEINTYYRQRLNEHELRITNIEQQTA